VAAQVDAMASGLEASGYRDGCPIATVALEAAASSEPIAREAVKAFDGWTGAIERWLRDAGTPSATARRRAVLVLAALEGALLLARAARDLAPLEEVREELRALLA
jgi:TetR/AcrR family transcriptional repressor of lmrAB and yxaGH operons